MIAGAQGLTLLEVLVALGIMALGISAAVGFMPRRPAAVATAARAWWTFTSRSRGSRRASGVPAATSWLSRTSSSSTVPRTRALTGETCPSTNASSVETWRFQ